MRKSLVWMLALMLLLLSVFGCQGTAKDATKGGTESGNAGTETGAEESSGLENLEKKVFSAGYAREDITPKKQVPMSGFGNVDYRQSTGYLDPIYTTCIAVHDEEGNTMLLFTTDLQNSKDYITKPVRERLHKLTGIPEDHILLTATHTHSAVALDKYTTNANVKEWLDDYLDKMVQAGLAAIRDLKPAELYWGTADCTGFNFVKHYFNEDGKAMGDNHGSGTPVRHVTEANGLVYMLEFRRPDAENIWILNWRAHPTMTGGSTKYDISPDFIAPLRDKLMAETGDYVTYFQGEAGNMNATSRIASENKVDRSKTTAYVEHGEKMADIILEAMKTVRKIESGPIQTIQTTYTGKANKSKAELLSQANEISTYWKSTNNMEGAKELCRKYGFESVYEAGAVVGRSTKGDTVSIEIHATRIGDLAIVHCPLEVFDALGVKLREESGLGQLLFFGYSNESNFYCPTTYGYEYGCYEADCTSFAKGEGEKMIEKYEELLAELFEK